MKLYMSDWLRDERGNITNNYKNVARAIQMLGCQAEDWNGPPTDDRWMLRLKGREESIPAVDAHRHLREMVQEHFGFDIGDFAMLTAWAVRYLTRHWDAVDDRGTPLPTYRNTRSAARALVDRLQYAPGREDEGRVSLSFGNDSVGLPLHRAAIRVREAIRDAFGFDPGRENVLTFVEAVVESHLDQV
ncbi:MAG: hypothetical protein BGO61_05140 [Thiobacillus sp. 65-69]|nr:hypothetical protein [Thiobacillus sp.]ODU89774.1 MAG: hypothetical protein ABT21_08810 [Thiobacillus sp. SCN 65-179]OJW37702.1 MAG: hypothetical protein BGO61_05140 [Thiobacillus sp. 65-69]